MYWGVTSTHSAQTADVRRTIKRDKLLPMPAAVRELDLFARDLATLQAAESGRQAELCTHERGAPEDCALVAKSTMPSVRAGRSGCSSPSSSSESTERWSDMIGSWHQALSRGAGLCAAAPTKTGSRASTRAIV